MCSSRTGSVPRSKTCSSGGVGGSEALGRRFDERSDRRGGPQWLTADHARERVDTLLVERRPGLGPQVVDRVLLRPRVAVDPLRDQRVVDVADGEDPSVERELTGLRPRG